MAKQMKRIEKRYVPQQESFRNLPGLRPAADPVLAAETPVVDPSAAKLKEMADAFSGINKALKDFYTMEKSFEETNRVTNKARALMGLAPVGGPGHLDYGVDYGYQEGQGLAESIKIRRELHEALEDNNYFVDPNNPEDSMAKLNKFSQEFITQRLSGFEGASAFLEGASRNLAEAKVEAMTVASKRISEAVVAQKLNNEVTILREHVDTWPEDIWRNPEALREAYNQATLGAVKRGTDRDAAGSLLLQVAEQKFTSGFGEAHDAGDLVGMRQQLSRMQSFVQASRLNDKSGQPLGSFVTGPDGKPKWKLESDVDSLVSTRDKMAKDFSSTLEDTNKKNIAQIKADSFLALSNGASPSEVMELITPLATFDPEGFLEARKFLVDLRTSQEYIDDTDLVRSLLGNMNYTMRDLSDLMSAGKISTTGAKNLAAALSRIKAADAQAVYMSNQKTRLYNEQSRMSAAELARSNAEVLMHYESLNGSNAAVATHVRLSTAAGKPVTNDMLVMIGDSAVKRETATKEAEAALKAKAAASAEALKAKVAADKTRVSTYVDATTALSELNVDQRRRVTMELEKLPEDKRDPWLRENFSKFTAARNKRDAALLGIASRKKSAEATRSPKAILDVSKMERRVELEFTRDNPFSSIESKKLAIYGLSELGVTNGQSN